MSNKQRQLQVVGEFNNIPEQYLPEPLKKGQIALYQLLDGRPNPLPIGDPARKKEFFFGNIVSIPPRDTIKLDNKFIQIGVVMETDNNKVTRVHKHSFAADKNNGLFSVTEGDIAMEKFYQYFELCNYNDSNPHRDQNVTPLFKRIDPAAEDKEVLRKGSALGTALAALTNFSDSDIRRIAGAMNMGTNETIESLRAQLMRKAMDNPQAFIDHVEDPVTNAKALVKRAIDLEIIGYIPVEKKFVWGSDGTVLATLEIAEGKDELDMMAEWLRTHTNGPAVQKQIEKLVKVEIKKRSVKGPDENE